MEASDARGNVSGSGPYEISFRVEDDGEVIVLSPYPNPFSYEAVFEIVLKAKNADLYTCNIHVTDVNGKPVAELSGGGERMRVGKNYVSWDGIGLDGYRLPNGIYFYRLSVEGVGMDTIHSGKLILLR